MKYYIQNKTNPNSIWSDEYGWVPKEPPWFGEDELFSSKRSDLPVDGEWKQYKKEERYE